MPYIKKCPEGTILRQEYSKKAYVRKDGVPVSKSVVREGCIKDLGKKGKGPKLITIKNKGELKSFGYSSSETNEQREKSLRLAVKETDKGHVIKRLNAISILTKNTNPKVSKIFHRDMGFVQKL